MLQKLLPTTFLTALSALFLTTAALGQARSGGFGNLFIGTAYNYCSSLSEALQAPDLLGSEAKSNTFMLLFGGAGFGLRPNGILLGGSGFGYMATTTTSKGKSRFGMGGGFFNIGYAILNESGVLCYPYIGIGGGGAAANIDNTGNAPLRFGSDTIAVGKNQTFATGGLAFDLGISIKYIVDDYQKESRTSRLGLVLGLDAGLMMMPAISSWHNSETDRAIDQYDNPFFLAPYIRATIGLSVLK